MCDVHASSVSWLVLRSEGSPKDSSVFPHEIPEVFLQVLTLWNLLSSLLGHVLSFISYIHATFLGLYPSGCILLVYVLFDCLKFKQHF